jgi:hypothetical protein
MLINNCAARACWRKWVGAQALYCTKKKMKCCLATELSKAHELPAAAAAASEGVPVVPPHVVDAAAEMLCLMRYFCASKASKLILLY